jgi:hypothetical protein
VDGTGPDEASLTTVGPETLQSVQKATAESRQARENIFGVTATLIAEAVPNVSEK